MTDEAAEIESLGHGLYARKMFNGSECGRIIGQEIREGIGLAVCLVARPGHLNVTILRDGDLFPVGPEYPLDIARREHHRRHAESDGRQCKQAAPPLAEHIAQGKAEIHLACVQ